MGVQASNSVAQARATLIGRSLAFTKAHLKLVLVIYGVLFASFAVFRLDHDIHGAAAGLSPYRQGQIVASMDMVNAHGPPLTAARSEDRSNLYPVGVDDDRGGFVYLPLIGYWLNTRDVDAL